MVTTTGISCESARQEVFRYHLSKNTGSVIQQNSTENSIPMDEAEVYQRLLRLEVSPRAGLHEDLRTTPLFTLAVKDTVEARMKNHSQDSQSQESKGIFSQYAVLGFHAGQHPTICQNEPILMNVNAPNSAFICGSQGSGKSYTLSCMLENCLIADPRIGRVSTPIAGVAFHYDPDSASSTAETAHLCSLGIRVNVLVSQSNEYALRTAYGKLPGAHEFLTVKPLLLASSDLTIDRMHKLMAFTDKKEAMPLYMSSALRILRQMAIDARGGAFDYRGFKRALDSENFSKQQSGPLELRLELLESFLDLAKNGNIEREGKEGSNLLSPKSLMNLQPGTLTIVDLTDPFMDPETACILFEICLSLVKEQQPSCGLVVALDEAHKFMTGSLPASNFADKLLATVREQRHNATRVLIATQEPTISGKLLDLCTVSIVHRFNSPEWFAALQRHLGAASKLGNTSGPEHLTMFDRIMALKVGESLVFAPSAFLCLPETGVASKLGRTTLVMKTRTRLGSDGGMSILASMPTSPRQEQASAPEPSQTVEKKAAACTNTLSKVHVASSAVGHKQSDQKKPTAPARNETQVASEPTIIPNKAKSHLALICWRCESIVVIQFPRPSLPNLQDVDRKSLPGGVAHCTCVKCKLREVPGTKKALNSFDTVRASNWRKGKIKFNKALQTDIRMILGSKVEHKMPVLTYNSNPAYVFLNDVQSQLERQAFVWMARVGRQGKHRSIQLSEHQDSAFLSSTLS